MKFIKIISILLMIIGSIILVTIITINLKNKTYQSYLISKKDINYISIPSINLKNILIDGITEEHLNLNYAAIEINDNIIIAGHAITSVFKNLYDIEINAKINLYYNGTLFKYYVIDKYRVNINQFNGFEYQDKLILITCIDHDNRFIVVSKK